MTATQISMAVIVLVIAIIDVVLIVKKGKQASLSAYIIRYYRLSRIGFWANALVWLTMGHLFWSMDTFDWMHEDQLKIRCEEFLKGGE